MIYAFLILTALSIFNIIAKFFWLGLFLDLVWAFVPLYLLAVFACLVEGDK